MPASRRVLLVILAWLSGLVAISLVCLLVGWLGLLVVGWLEGLDLAHG